MTFKVFSCSYFISFLLEHDLKLWFLLVVWHLSLGSQIILSIDGVNYVLHASSPAWTALAGTWGCPDIVESRTMFLIVPRLCEGVAQNPNIDFWDTFVCFYGRTADTWRCSSLILLKVRPSSLVSDFWPCSQLTFTLAAKYPTFGAEHKVPIALAGDAGDFLGHSLSILGISVLGHPLSLPRPVHQPVRDVVLCQTPVLFLGLHHVRDGRRICQLGALTSWSPMDEHGS